MPDAAFKKAMAGDGQLADYPISLVITNNTLVQQWNGVLTPHPAVNSCPPARDCAAAPARGRRDEEVRA